MAEGYTPVATARNAKRHITVENRRFHQQPGLIAARTCRIDGVAGVGKDCWKALDGWNRFLLADKSVRATQGAWRHEPCDPHQRSGGSQRRQQVRFLTSLGLFWSMETKSWDGKARARTPVPPSFL